MSTHIAAWLLVLVAIFAANLPWISDRFLFFLATSGKGKRPWMRLLEWLLLYFLTGLLALGLEKKVTGELHSQDWEFYAVTFSLFVVFALPGFIYRHDLKKHLDRR
ncbi:MAG: DUF2818 family protein [Gammaproteobacteria bacterium]|nr:DUF2818 family protein [Gammaproteobacteria bacterium]MCI0590447.1 DUF2818 family protein [Gammaproteobacteria bacterium]